MYLVLLVENERSESVQCTRMGSKNVNNCG